MKKITRNQRLRFLINLCISAIFLALGFVLPFLTGQIPEIGNMLLPMHIPVLFCGFICGAPWGAIIGFVTPLLRSLCLGMPPIFPTAAAMAFELYAYGLFSGLIYHLFKRKNILKIYIALVSAMILGRGVWGLASLIFTSIQNNPLTWSAFLASAFIEAVPGIILQLVLIPIVMFALERTGVMEMKQTLRRTRYPKSADPKDVEKVLNLIDAKLSAAPLIIAIDGRCGAGKTTLAQALADARNYPIIHADDFFLRLEQRTPQRLEIPGQNLDWERLKAEVIAPIRQGRAVSYQPWDCQTKTFGITIEVPQSQVYIIEGSYTLNENLRDAYNLRIFVTVNPKEQLKRIGRRATHNDVEAFKQKWIPLEEKYFEACHVQECANLIIDTK